MAEKNEFKDTQKFFGKYLIWIPLYPFFQSPKFRELRQKTSQIWPLDVEKNHK